MISDIQSHTDQQMPQYVPPPEPPCGEPLPESRPINADDETAQRGSVIIKGDKEDDDRFENKIREW